MKMRVGEAWSCLAAPFYWEVLFSWAIVCLHYTASIIACCFSSLMNLWRLQVDRFSPSLGFFLCLNWLRLLFSQKMGSLHPLCIVTHCGKEKAWCHSAQLCSFTRFLRALEQPQVKWYHLVSSDEENLISAQVAKDSWKSVSYNWLDGRNARFIK